MLNDELAHSAGTVNIGKITVNRMGLGTNRIGDNEESRTLLKAAVSYGINFIDTAHRYTNGVSETVIGDTLAPYKNGLVIATKGGLGSNGPTASPKALRSHLEDSLKRLKVDHIDLYQLHRLDPEVPFADSVGALKQFQDEGKISYIGLSEVSVNQLKEAEEITHISSVQNEYSVIERKYEDLLSYCEQQNIVFIPWFPLGGLAGGAEKVVEVLAPYAEKYGALPQQIALAWLLRRSPMMLPIPGTLSVDHLESNLKSAFIDLSPEDYEAISEIA